MSADEQKIPRSRVGRPWLTAAIVVGAMVIQAAPGVSPSLEFERGAIRTGEVWRLWTSHLVHFGWNHLLWNVGVLALAGVWVERIAPRRARWLYVLAPLVIGGVLLAFDPRLLRYAGLSGLAIGVVALLAFTHLGRAAPGRWFWIGVLILVGGKIVIELIVQRPVFARFADADVQTVPLAHLGGFVSAALVHGTRRRFHV